MRKMSLAVSRPDGSQLLDPVLAIEEHAEMGAVDAAPWRLCGGGGWGGQQVGGGGMAPEAPFSPFLLRTIGVGGGGSRGAADGCVALMAAFCVVESGWRLAGSRCELGRCGGVV